MMCILYGYGGLLELELIRRKINLSKKSFINSWKDIESMFIKLSLKNTHISGM